VRDDVASPLILYLSTYGPHALETFGVDDAKIIAALSAASNGTIVRVNYRSGAEARYPTPVHDVLAGYDYVKERFAAESWTTRAGRVKKTHLRIGVCGQLVGGSLATALGLTESHLAQDRIAAVAVNSPIIDWVFPNRELSIADAMTGDVDDKADEALEKTVRRKRKSKARLPSWEAFSEMHSIIRTSTLEAIRTELFRKSANYFDPFASPVHFFRSSSSNIPADPTIIADGDDPLSALQLAKSRKAHRIFPPSNSTLILPNVRLSGGVENPLYDSNEEFVKLLRRSIVRTALSRASTQAMWRPSGR
jgi:acetyl esterase/lipase